MKKKDIWIEYLRIFAVFWVIYNHTAIYGWLLYSNAEVTLSSFERAINIALSVFCKVSVPLFLMISGALLLGRDEPMKKNLKRIRRMVILILVTAVANYIYFRSVHHVYAEGIASFPDFLRELYGNTNLCTYYLWLYLAFLIMLPLLRRIAVRPNLILYSVGIFTVLCEVLPVLEVYFSFPVFNLKAYSGFFSLNIVCPLFGYYIATGGAEPGAETKLFSKKAFIWINIAGVVSFILSITVVLLVNLQLEPILLSAWLFYDAKYLSMTEFAGRLRQRPHYPIWEKCVLFLSQQTLGAFLLSGVLMWKCFGVYTRLVAHIPGTLAALVWVLVSLMVCQAVTAVLRLFPPLRKIL